MPKAPRDKASATPKKAIRKTAANTEAVPSVEVSSGSNGHNGNGVHSENATVAAVPAAVTTPAVAEVKAPFNRANHTEVSDLEDRIRARAFEIYLERGGNGGSPEQDWLRAKQELSVLQ